MRKSSGLFAEGSLVLWRSTDTAVAYIKDLHQADLVAKSQQKGLLSSLWLSDQLWGNCLSHTIVVIQALSLDESRLSKALILVPFVS